MVDHHAHALDIVFRALADPTRRAMIQNLARRPHTVGELAEPFDISLAAASKHIQALERAGIVKRTVQGRTHLCRLEGRPMREGIEWMRRYERFWTERLDALEAQLRPEASSATASRPVATATGSDGPIATEGTAAAAPPVHRAAPRGPRIKPMSPRSPRHTPRRKEP